MHFKNKKIFFMIITMILCSQVLISAISINLKKNIEFNDNLINEYITIKGKLRKVKENSIVLINTKYTYKGKDIINIKNKMAEININRKENSTYSSYKRDEEIIMRAKLIKSGILIMFFEEGEIQ